MGTSWPVPEKGQSAGAAEESCTSSPRPRLAACLRETPSFLEAGGRRVLMFWDLVGRAATGRNPLSILTVVAGSSSIFGCPAVPAALCPWQRCSSMGIPFFLGGTEGNSGFAALGAFSKAFSCFLLRNWGGVSGKRRCASERKTPGSACWNCQAPDHMRDVFPGYGKSAASQQSSERGQDEYLQELWGAKKLQARATPQPRSERAPLVPAPPPAHAAQPPGAAFDPFPS